MIDLQTAIADFYAEKSTPGEASYTMRPSVETEGELPEFSNDEGDVRYVKDNATYFIYDCAQWNTLLSTPVDGTNFTLATEEEVLAALKAGENG